MTSTKPGSQVGGYRIEVDQQKLGPALLITAGLILGMRTIRWEATHSDGLAEEEWEKEVEHSARVAKRMLAFLTTRYGCLFSLSGVDEESLTEQELDSRIRGVEGALRGLPEGSCLYQYTRVITGCELPYQPTYPNPVTEVFAKDRLRYFDQSAGFRSIDLHWCLTLEPSKAGKFERKPQENATENARLLAELEKTATRLQLKTYLASRADDESKLTSEMARAFGRKLRALRGDAQLNLPMSA